MATTQTAAERINEAIRTAERSKKWTAEKSGIPLSTFLRKTRGFGDFTVSEIARVARALGIHPAELLPTEFRDAA